MRLQVWWTNKKGQKNREKNRQVGRTKKGQRNRQIDRQTGATNK